MGFPETHPRVLCAVNDELTMRSDALLERDQPVVGDLDVFGADRGAALGDVRSAQCELAYEWCCRTSVLAAACRLHLRWPSTTKDG